MRLRPDPSAKPPHGAVTLDWAHPLAAHLVFCTVLTEGAGYSSDLVTGARGVALGATPARWSATARGLSLKGQTTTAGNGMSFGMPALSADVTLGTTAATIAALISLPQAADTQIWSRFTSGGVGWQFGDINANGWIGVQVIATTVTNLIAAAVAPALNTPTLIVVAWNPSDATASHVRIDYNGVPQSHVYDNNGSVGGAYPDGAGDVRMFCSQGGYSTYSGLQHNLAVYVWKQRQLTTAESLELTRDPYALVRPILRRRVWVSTGGAPPVTSTRRLSVRGA